MKYTLVLLLAMVPLAVFAQLKDGIPLNRTLKIEEKRKMIHCKVLNQKLDFTTLQGRTYYWFLDGKINHNLSGFAGNLLHGKYQVFNQTGLLIEQGHFKKGLKDGTWKFWNDKGDLIQITIYNEGLKHGIESLYTAGVQEIIPYKMGRIHGKKIIETPDTTISIRYRNGIEIKKEAKKDKQNIFQWLKGKKEKETEEDEVKRKQIPPQKD